MNLSYPVLYVSDLDASRTWYESALGLQFTAEQHGTGPQHYSTQLGVIVLELYPAGSKPVTRTRIGLALPAPGPEGWEPQTLTDPDGNVVELTLSTSSNMTFTSVDGSLAVTATPSGRIIGVTRTPEPEPITFPPAIEQEIAEFLEDRDA